MSIKAKSAVICLILALATAETTRAEDQQHEVKEENGFEVGNGGLVLICDEPLQPGQLPIQLVDLWEGEGFYGLEPRPAAADATFEDYIFANLNELSRLDPLRAATIKTHVIHILDNMKFSTQLTYDPHRDTPRLPVPPNCRLETAAIQIAVLDLDHPHYPNNNGFFTYHHSFNPTLWTSLEDYPRHQAALILHEAVRIMGLDLAIHREGNLWTRYYTSLITSKNLLLLSFVEYGQRLHENLNWDSFFPYHQDGELDVLFHLDEHLQVDQYGTILQGRPIVNHEGLMDLTIVIAGNVKLFPRGISGIIEFRPDGSLKRWHQAQLSLKWGIRTCVHHLFGSFIFDSTGKLQKAENLLATSNPLDPGWQNHIELPQFKPEDGTYGIHFPCNSVRTTSDTIDFYASGLPKAARLGDTQELVKNDGYTAIFEAGTYLRFDEQGFVLP